MITKHLRTAALLWTALFGLLFMAGCGDDVATGSGGGGSTTERIVSFTSSPAEVEYGSEATLSGQLVDSAGTGFEGRTVAFYADPQENGYFIPGAVTTGSSGSFSTRFVPLDTGSVQITVASTAASANLTTTVVMSEGYQSGDWRFEFDVTPGFALADGNDVSDFTVEIWDADNTPIADGQEVRIEVGERFQDVNGDGYFTENVDIVTEDINENHIWDRVGTAPRTVTSSGGSISFSYTSGTLAGLIYVRATVFDSEGNANSGEFPLALRPSEDIASIAITSDRNEIQVKATGGIEFADLTALCFDAYGNQVQSEIPVEFFIVYGPGGGERFTISPYDSATTSYDTITVVTNVVGEATATIFSGIVSGTVMIQARNGDVYSNTTLININAGPPYEISVGVDPCNIRGWDFVNVTADVVAIVNDIYGNPVADTTEIYFWTEEGTVDAASITIDGVGSVVYRSGDVRNDGLAHIRAETAGRTVVDSTILIVSGPAVFVDAYGYSSTLYANGEDYTDIWVDARDINNNFLVANTAVEILFNDGTIITGALADGCVGSLARMRYKSKVLTRDYVYSTPDNGIGRYLSGSVQVGGVNGPSAGVSITLLTGNASTKSSEISMDGTVAPGSQVACDVLIKDRAGNPLGGHSLSGSADLGSIAPETVVTNEYGEAGFTYTAPGGIGNAVVTIQDNDPGYGGIILSKKVKIDVSE